MLRLCLLLASACALRGPWKASTRALTSLREAEPKESNFEDDAVDCVSEGGTMKIGTAKPRIEMEQVMQSTLEDSKRSKQSNFEDEDVTCVSEGGTWRVDRDMMDMLEREYKMPTTSRKSLQEAFQKILEAVNLEATPLNIVALSDTIDTVGGYENSALLRSALNSIRYNKLVTLLKNDRDTYIETASFLSTRISRQNLPNLQDVQVTTSAAQLVPVNDLLPDCSLPNITFYESPLDRFLLGVFRGLVQKEIGWKSETAGIRGLLEEGRHYMLSDQGTDDHQHAFVKRVLAGLMTPVLPPFYRIFMAGIVPSTANGDPQWLEDAFQSVAKVLPQDLQRKISPGTQLGPWFYAPYLTSFVTPVFLSFLVGPSRTNRRVDGALGGIVVEVRFRTLLPLKQR